jgi:hypothetical protein
MNTVKVFTRQEFELQSLSICHCRFADFFVSEDEGALATNFSVDLDNVEFVRALHLLHFSEIKG